MGSEWRHSTLGAIAHGSNGLVDGPFGSNLPASSYTEEGVPVIRGSNLTLGLDRFSAGTFVYVSDATAERLARSLCRPGDIIFTKKGTIGQTGFIPNGLHQRYLLSSNQMKLTVDRLKVDPLFVYYWVSSAENVAKVLRDSESTGVPKINLAYLKTFPILLPSLATQSKIAEFLGALDDKIELNRQINTTLEAMVQALFKSWFVDFDPVIDNALAAGNEIPAELAARAEHRAQAAQQTSSYLPHTLPDAMRQQFPDRFVFTDTMGWVPEGWEPEPFGSLIETTIGGDWGKEQPDDRHVTQVAIIRGTDIPSVRSSSKGAVPLRWVEEKKYLTRELVEGDIVIEISGGSPKQPTGRSVYMTQASIDLYGGAAVAASFCRKMRPRTKEQGLYAALHLDFIYGKGKMWEYQNQSTGISNFQTSVFLNTELVIVPPNMAVLREFFERVRPLVDKSRSAESQYLANLRDTLLPKLLSGQLRVPDAQTAVDMALAET